jgi:TPR repeat protein
VRLLVFVLIAALVPTSALAQSKRGDDGGGGDDPDPSGKPGEQPDFKVLESPFQALEDKCVLEGHGLSCFRAGRKWREGTADVKPDREQAANLLSAGCRFGNADACVMAGDMYLRLEAGLRLLTDGTVQVNVGEAAYYHRSACEKGRLKSCGLWGDMMYDPRSLLPSPDAEHYNLDADLLMARQAWADGCNEGDIEGSLPLPPEGSFLHVDLRSCARMATLWSGAGTGNRKDPARRLYYLQRACRIEGGDAYCEQAEEAAKTAADADGAEPAPLPDRPSSGRDLNAGVNEPDARRFEAQEMGITSREAGDKPHRFEFELGIGARMVYPTTVVPLGAGGVKWRLGFNFWFHLFGFSIEGGVLTNDPFNEQYRTYTRMMHTLSFKMALPLDVRLPIRARAWFVLGVGPTVGALQLQQQAFELTYGVREMIQFVLSSDQERGPRQWGAIRVEQQQSWWETGGAEIEHSTQVVFILGFTAGGWGPSWRKYASEKKDAPFKPRRKLTPEPIGRGGG